MPGLFGFVDRATHSASPEATQALLQKMACAIQLEKFQQSELYSAEGIGLGSVHIPLMNAEAQPVWNADHSRCLIWYGEIFDTPRLVQKLAKQGVNTVGLSQAQLLLQIYETFGDAFVRELNGAFLIAIWNADQRELLLINDFLGQHLLYYTQYNNRVAFSSLANVLLADPALPRRIDELAITEFIFWEMVLRDRTFLQDVRLLPPGSILKVRDGQVCIQNYWQLRFADEYSLRPRQEYFDQFDFLLKQSIKRQAPTTERVGINLSGGLDSRTVLGLVSTILPLKQIQSFTFGLPDSDDVMLAAELARMAGTNHHSREFNAGFLFSIIDKALRLTDGMSNCVHFHAMTLLPEQSQLVDLIYTGYLGDTVLSTDAQMDWIIPYTLKAARHIAIDRMGYVFAGEKVQDILDKEFYTQVGAIYDAEVNECLDENRAATVMNAVNHFEMLYNGRRNTRYGNDLVRNQLLCRNPFCDKDFVEFCLQIPPGLRIDRILIRAILGQSFHSLAKVPWDKTGLPLVECLRDYVERIKQQARWHTGHISGLNHLKERKLHPMHNYDQWMRGPLRPWVEETLLSPLALKRGYIRPEIQKQLITSHMAGKNNAREIGLLLSLELWHRMFID